MEDLVVALGHASGSNEGLRTHGTDTVKMFGKRSSAIADFMSICESKAIAVNIRVLAGQWLYKKFDNKRCITPDNAMLLTGRLLTIVMSSVDQSLLSGLCRLIARLIGAFGKPSSIAELFSLGPNIGMTVLTELALEVSPSEPLSSSWATEILTAIEHSNSLTERICNLLTLWVPVFPKQRLVNSPIIANLQIGLADDFISEVFKHAACPDLLPTLASYLPVNRVMFVELASHLAPSLPQPQLVQLSDTLSRLSWESIASSDLELLEHLTGYWEAAPALESTAWVVACMAVFPASFDSWSEDDRERFRDIRRDVRDSLRAMAKSNAGIPAALIGQLVTSDWRSFETGLHALSAVAKYIPKLVFTAQLRSLATHLDPKTTHRAVLCAYLLLLHVCEEMRTPESVRLVVSCLAIPHWHPVYPFASKQDHVAVVAIARCELTAGEYQHVFQFVRFSNLRRNLTKQSAFILLEVLAAKSPDLACTLDLVRFIADDIDASDLAGFLAKSPHAAQAITSGILSVEKIASIGPAECVPRLIITCMQHSQSDIWGNLLKISLHTHTALWAPLAAEVFRITGSAEFVYELSGVLIGKLESCNSTQLSAWLAFLSAKPVNWSGREAELLRWFAIAERFNSLQSVAM